MDLPALAAGQGWSGDRGMRYVAIIFGAAAVVMLGTHFAQQWLQPYVPVAIILLVRMAIGFAIGILLAKAIIRRVFPPKPRWGRQPLE